MVKQIRDKAEALRLYAKQAGECLAVQNDIAEIKLRAERRIGEFARELPREEGKVNQYTKNAAPHDGERQTKTSILAAAGITHPERYAQELAGQQSSSLITGLFLQSLP